MHRPAPEEVEVDMIDALAGFGICVHQKAKAAFCDSPFPGDLIGHLKQMPDKSVVFFLYLK